MRLGFIVRGLAVLALAGWSAWGGSGRAGTGTTIGPGVDLFETVPGTNFEFDAAHAIPAGFFEPGSEPFSGVIKLGGAPLDSFEGRDTGTTDTIVRRKRAADLSGRAGSDTVPIELVALNLVSVQPITVTYPGAKPDQQWDVYVEETSLKPSKGSMTITKANANGGTFDSVLEVRPLFIFVRQTDGKTRKLDMGLPQYDAMSRLIRVRGDDVPWQLGCPPGILVVPGLNDDYCPSATATKPVITTERARLARHIIRPPRFREIDRFPDTRARITIITQAGSEAVDLQGPTVVRVNIGRNGEASDTDGDGKDQVQTEMVALELGGTSSMGPVKVRLRDVRKHPFRRSLGEIEERVNVRHGRLDLPPFADKGAADSFFDVYFEVEVAGKVLHTDRPKRMRARITYKPPRVAEFYFSPSVIELLDRLDRPTGIKIGSARHTPVPPERDVFQLSTARVVMITPLGSATVSLEGPTIVEVKVGPNGEASDTDGDGKDQVRTEMVQLELTGASPMGPVTMRLRDPASHPRKRTLGSIEETENTQDGRLDLQPFAPDGSAESYFNVYFEVEVGGKVLHNHAPKVMRRRIWHKPPGAGEIYFSPTVIPLFTADEKPSGYSIGGAYHTPDPPEVDEFPQVLGQLLLDTPDGPQAITLTGTATIEAATDDTGVAHDTDGNNLDQIETELVALSLTGSMGTDQVNVTIRGLEKHPGKRSAGEIEETTDAEGGRLDIGPFHEGGAGDSFFDVFFEVGVEGVTPQHNDTPVRMAGTVRRKPAGPGDLLWCIAAVALVGEDEGDDGYAILSLSLRFVPGTLTTGR